MEIAVEPNMPTYSGGLGVLAGDTVRAAADMGVPMVAVTLLHRKGYFTQKITAEGWQVEEPVQWKAEDYLQEIPQRASVELEGRTVYLRAWRYRVTAAGGFSVPVYFLDTDLPENSEADRALTHHLYGGDARYRLCQEAIFGVGGVRMLHVLGYDWLNRYHMNEGHAALLTVELLLEEMRQAERTAFEPIDVERVKKKCVFTTHTPISAGHDRFPMDLVNDVLRHPEMMGRQELFFVEGHLDMTHVALSLSHYVNGVAKRHGEVSQAMFSRPVDAITNGVHASTWASEPFQRLFDRTMPGWREDNFLLRCAMIIPREEIQAAHLESKRALLARVKQETGVEMKEEVITLGFARRATGYKRADLFLHDVERLKKIAGQFGPLQVVYAGKAHPHDTEGKEMIHRIFQMRQALQPQIQVVYLANYDMTLGKLMTAGVDVWLNTPHPPLEASGTSGMKAALNGVPSLSILDGWWIEGHLEGITGWAIGTDEKPLKPNGDRRARDAESLYAALEKSVLPAFTQQRDRFIDIMRQAIALNGSYFQAQRMMQDYVLNAYFR